MQAKFKGGSQALTTIQEIYKEKELLCQERDLCAELYNLWITKLHDVQDNSSEYDMYKKMIENLEPYTQMLKEKIRELNRLICEKEGVDSISETDFMTDCVYKYGFDKPQGK